MQALMSGDFTAASDPSALFRAWLDEAARCEPNDPTAMALATVDPRGLPNVRTVLMKGFDARGFAFYTNRESAKGRELDAAPKAALVFHWKSLGRQVRARGPVEPVCGEEADAYFTTRPYGSRIGAWASDQSRPLDARETLAARVSALEAHYPQDADIPRPPHWTGYRVIPLAIEFWQERPFRLHDRIVFRRIDLAAEWTKERLYP